MAAPFHSFMPGKIDGATRAKLLKELDTHDDAKLQAALATCFCLKMLDQIGGKVW
jgi:hypothetical protein